MTTYRITAEQVAEIRDCVWKEYRSACGKVAYWRQCVEMEKGVCT